MHHCGRNDGLLLQPSYSSIFYECKQLSFRSLLTHPAARCTPNVLLPESFSQSFISPHSACPRPQILRRGLVHCHLRARHLYPKPRHRLPHAAGKSFPSLLVSIFDASCCDVVHCRTCLWKLSSTVLLLPPPLLAAPAHTRHQACCPPTRAASSVPSSAASRRRSFGNTLSRTRSQVLVRACGRNV